MIWIEVKGLAGAWALDTDPIKAQLVTLAPGNFRVTVLLPKGTADGIQFEAPNIDAAKRRAAAWAAEYILHHAARLIRFAGADGDRPVLAFLSEALCARV